jgi:uncharacterized protein (DUF2062 family)
MRKKEGNRLQRFFKFLYLKLFRINDSPQRIALGFGAGAFMGIFRVPLEPRGSSVR